MKDFMLIFSGATEQYEFSPEEMQQHMQQWFAWIDDLKAKNIYQSGEALLPGGKTVKGSKALVTDGPFAESKELIGGYFLIKANTIEDAALIAQGCPDLRLEGNVEIREVMQFEM
jgi:hypothetical protein